jgi:hypothetical protein
MKIVTTIVLVVSASLLLPSAIFAADPKPEVAAILGKIEMRKTQKAEAAARNTVNSLVGGLRAANAQDRGDAAAIKAPRSLEEQVAAFESALAEGLHERDWKMVELAASGLKAANLTGKDLELSMLRAERNAAWTNAGYMTQYRSECWGLGARALAGDTEARELLGTHALQQPEPVAAPDYKNAKVDLKAFQRAHAEYQKFNFRIQQRDEALLILALMKEPGIFEKLKAAMQSRKPQPNGLTIYSGVIQGNNTLLTAALLAGKEEGLQLVLDYAADEKGSLAEQVSVISALQNLLVWRNREMAFSIEHEAAAALPENVGEVIGRSISSIIKRYAATEQKGNENTLYQLIMIANQLPANSLTKEAAQALSNVYLNLNPQVHHTVKPQIDEILRKNGIDPNTAVSPPRPPAEF